MSTLWGTIWTIPDKVNYIDNFNHSLAWTEHYWVQKKLNKKRKSPPTSQIPTALSILLTKPFTFHLGDRQLEKSDRELVLCFEYMSLYSIELQRGLGHVCWRKVILFLMKLFPVKDIKRYQEFKVMGHLARGKRNKMDLYLSVCNCYLLRQEGKWRWGGKQRRGKSFFNCKIWNTAHGRQARYGSQKCETIVFYECSHIATTVSIDSYHFRGCIQFVYTTQHSTQKRKRNLEK